MTEHPKLSDAPDKDVVALAREGDEAAYVTRALSQLRPEYRECFVLHYVEELSYDEIADVMNVPVGTVGTYLHRARAELKRMHI